MHASLRMSSFVQGRWVPWSLLRERCGPQGPDVSLWLSTPYVHICMAIVIRYTIRYGSRVELNQSLVRCPVTGVTCVHVV